MSEIAEKLRTVLDVLPPDDRAELAYHLIRSLDDDSGRETEAAWKAVLARRAEEIKSGKAQWRPAQEVFARLREKYS